MFRPQIQKTSTLFLIAIFNLLMVYLAVKSETKIKRLGYHHKVIAAQKMNDCIKEINKHVETSKFDIYNTGLLGLKGSSITTIHDPDSSMRKSKLLTTHPNFAALIIELFYESGIGDGDTIAVSMTGSFPGANIALISACEAMNIKPVIISSAGSSSWGANREDFPWPSIENLLYYKKLINNKSIAYSIGGDNDNGDNLPDNGIEILESIIPNKSIFINEFTLSDNINKRFDIFKKGSSNYSMYVNIGGGASSLGMGDDKDTLQVGLINLLDVEDMEFDEFRYSVAYRFLNPSEHKIVMEPIPMLNIKKIINLVPGYYKKEFFDGDMRVAEGTLFYKYDSYNPTVILLCLLLSLGVITGVGIFSHLQIKRRMETHEIDSII